jgi:membrane fusion protein, multidrug efflux system
MQANDSSPARQWRRARLRLTIAACLAAGWLAADGPERPAALAAPQDAETRAATAPGSFVTYVPVKRGKPETELTLPASLLGLQEATLFARTSGYLKRWFVDLGDPVEAGQLIAVIETPEVDQELQQAEANLVHAKVNLDLARATASRYQSLRGQEAVSEQDIDEKESALAARRADVKATEAQIRRLRQLKSFAAVRAPFSGNVVARNVEVGSLIAAGSAAPNGWLFRIVQANPIRAMVGVPQSQMASVATGQPVDILVRERPGKIYRGKVARKAGALDAASRTLTVEVRVPNDDGDLVPGMYAQARFGLQAERPPLVVSGNALIVGGEGPRVALLDAGDVIRIQKVRLGRDYGKEVEIVEGVHEGERIVMNPRDTLETGMKVKAIAAPKPHEESPKAATGAASPKPDGPGPAKPDATPTAKPR